MVPAWALPLPVSDSYKGLFRAQIAQFSPAGAGLSSASTGQNRQHHCFPSALQWRHGGGVGCGVGTMEPSASTASLAALGALLGISATSRNRSVAACQRHPTQPPVLWARTTSPDTGNAVHAFYYTVRLEAKDAQPPSHALQQAFAFQWWPERGFRYRGAHYTPPT